MGIFLFKCPKYEDMKPTEEEIPRCQPVGGGVLSRLKCRERTTIQVISWGDDEPQWLRRHEACVRRRAGAINHDPPPPYIP